MPPSPRPSRDELLQALVKLLESLPGEMQVIVTAGGVHSIWDLPAAEFSRPVARAGKLTPMESDILEALAGEQLTGQVLADKAGYPFSSNFRSTLAAMVRHGLLTNDEKGYSQEMPAE